MRKKRRRPTLDEPEALDAILDRAGESRFARVRPPFELPLWRDAVGARIADRAQPISLVDGVLLLRVASSVWSHELSMLSEELCTRLRARGIAVTRLRFRVGEAPLAQRTVEPRISRSVPAVRALPQELARSLGGVEDEALRSAIARAAAANLAFQSFTARPTEGDGSVSEARRGARAPRDAGSGTAPPARTTAASRGAAPRTPAGDPDRRR